MHEAISKEQGAVNELGIVVEGKHVVLTVNGTTITEFNGIPPESGGLVGLDFGTQSTDSGPTTLTFADFQVRALPE